MGATTQWMRKRKTLNCSFIQTTFNTLERFFSSAGYAASGMRQKITPELLEQLFLNVNRKFWGVETVSVAIVFMFCYQAFATNIDLNLRF